MQSDPDGVLTFKPEFSDRLPIAYSDSTKDGQTVVYQRGTFVEQFTITSGKPNERTVVKVRFAPQLWRELVQFEVEMGPV